MDEVENPDTGIADGESTHEYPPGTPGYSALDESSDASGPLEPAGRSASEPFWKRGGYESLQDYLDHQNRLKALYEPLPKGTPVPVATLPGEEAGDVGPPPGLERRRRQVNVKLRSAEREDLEQAAVIYGLPPATLARALVNRGVRAILEANGFRRDQGSGS